MSNSLFHSIIFGPVRSRRLGVSLGINLLPTHVKFCSFNCIYCECGWTEASDVSQANFHPREEIFRELETKLLTLKGQQLDVDSLTYAGNGEPTMHPQFNEIVDDTLSLRDKYFPLAKVTVLSNSTMLSNEKVFRALLKTNNLMKLDSGTEETFQIINNPRISITLSEIVNNLKRFDGRLVIQSMFVRGKIGDKIIDNTQESELNTWLKHLDEIKPAEVQVYSIDRRPPLAQLEKISREELLEIANKVEQLNLKAIVY
ncbi:MAG: radical SAM protein [Bacteroidales bacterium]|jgi:wyosine [tRNA(Phe)-imidazoG37] synthetase (radical SAM superfamily)|nr:radical SAM protein [Bacteroidales bacterium]MDD4214786.1 radical SAM protein [Bacteroidales bacterium]